MVRENSANRFPNLSRIALDLLSIPAMSADPERFWSGAKITVADRHGKLKIETIEALECLKSWLEVDIAVEDNLKDEDTTLLSARGGENVFSS